MRSNFKIGSIELSSDFFKRSSIGLWVLEFDEGKEPRMYLDKDTYASIGLDDSISPEETYKIWYKRVHPSYLIDVKRAFNDMIKGKKIEIQYHWVHPSGNELTIRCGGCRNFDYKDGIRIEGCEENLTSIVLDEYRKQQELTDIISAISLDYCLLAHINFDTFKIDHLSSHASKYGLEALEKNDDYNESIKIIYNYVIDLDKQNFIDSVKPEVIKENIKDGKIYTLHFKMNVNGDIETYQVKFFQHEKHFKNNCCLIALSNEEETIRKTDQEKAVLSALGGDFESVSYIDPINGNEIIYRISDDLLLDKEIYNAPNYNDRIIKFVNKYVYEEDREKLLLEANLKTVKDNLNNNNNNNNNVCFVNFRYIKNGNALFYQIKYVLVKIDGYSHIVMGMINVDEERKTQVKEKEELKEKLDIINVLAADYSSIFYINPKTDFVKINSISDETYSRFSTFIEATKSYTDGFNFFVKHLVYPADQDWLLKKCSLENINDELKNKKEFAVIFRAKRASGVHFCEMKFVKADEINDEPTAVVMGFADKDTSITQSFVNRELVKDYASIFLVDLNTDKYKFVYRSDKSGFADVSGGCFTDTIKEYTSRVEKEYRDRWYNFSDINYIKEVLTKEDSIEYVYKLGGVELKWRRCSLHAVERINNVPSLMIMTYSTLDYQSALTYELNQKIEDQNKELALKQIELEEALLKAQAASRAKTTFLNNMSHDIRTPMNAIIGFTNLAIKHIENIDHVNNYLNKIYQSSEHLLSLINDVLDMSRIEAGKVSISETDEKLSDIIHTLMDIVQSDISSKKLNLLVNTHNIKHENIICDKLRLNQILLNIISNSIKYTNTGGTISFVVSEEDSNNNDYCNYKFVIKDNGIGMSKEFLQTIFDPFTRVNSSTVSGIQGTGLGMSITKSLLELMNGSISVESEEGIGTEITINISFRKSYIDNEMLEKEFKDLHCLVIDDDEDSCLYETNMLNDIGMMCEFCNNSDEALVKIDECAKDNQYQVFFIDYIMHDKNGLEIAKIIRNKMGNDVAIFIVTAYDYSNFIDEAIKIGVNGLIMKPLFVSDINRKLLDYYEMNKQDSVCETKDYKIKGKKVLLVEDNELNSEIAIEILSEHNLIIDSANDGIVAVEKIKNAKEGDYDFILMDIQMPIMDGYEATKQIRLLNEVGKKIPIIAMTANAFEEDRQLAYKAGMNDFVSKPIDFDVLLDVIKKYC